MSRKRPRALWRALALPGLALYVGCKPWSPWLWGTYMVQQADLALSLARVRRPVRGGGSQPLPLPWATECTLLRAYAAAALLAGGYPRCAPRPRRALVLGVVTDILDGFLARSMGTRTPLGARLDGLYDAYLLLAAARAARRRGGLTRRTEQMLWLRFGAVLLAGAVARAVTRRPVGVQSTWPGKVATGIQAATVYSALGARPGGAHCSRPWLMALGTVLAVSGQVMRLRALRAPGALSAP